MKKYIYFSLVWFVFFMLYSSYQSYCRIYLYNNDRTKIVTIYRPFYQFTTQFYFTPYKYTNILPPNKDYIEFNPGVETISDSEEEFSVLWENPIVFKMDDAYKSCLTNSRIVELGDEKNTTRISELNTKIGSHLFLQFAIFITTLSNSIVLVVIVIVKSFSIIKKFWDTNK